MLHMRPLELRVRGVRLLDGRPKGWGWEEGAALGVCWGEGRVSVSWGSDEAAEEGLPQSSPKGQMHLGRVARDRARGPGLGHLPR